MAKKEQTSFRDKLSKVGTRATLAVASLLPSGRAETSDEANYSNPPAATANADATDYSRPFQGAQYATLVSNADAEAKPASDPKLQLFSVLRNNPAAFAGTTIQKYSLQENATGGLEEEKSTNLPLGTADGRVLSTNLKSLIGDTPFATMSFGFDGCSAYCPKINNCLTETGKRNPDNVVSIVTSIFPLPTQAARDSLVQSLRKDGINQDLIILSPQTQQQTLKIQQALDRIVNLRKPELHNPDILLYSNNGTHLDEKSSIRNTPGAFTNWVSSHETSRGR